MKTTARKYRRENRRARVGIVCALLLAGLGLICPDVPRAKAAPPPVQETASPNVADDTATASVVQDGPSARLP